MDRYCLLWKKKNYGQKQFLLYFPSLLASFLPPSLHSVIPCSFPHLTSPPFLSNPQFRYDWTVDRSIRAVSTQGRESAVLHLFFFDSECLVLCSTWLTPVVFQRVVSVETVRQVDSNKYFHWIPPGRKTHRGGGRYSSADSTDRWSVNIEVTAKINTNIAF